MRVFFTSDTHFYHKNIIEYCDRPYRTLDGQPDTQAMNRDMVARWNAMVEKDDLVCHLGDFGFGNPGRLLGIRQALNGRIRLVKGNHDSQPSKWLLPGVDTWSHSVQAGEVFMGHVPPGPSDYRDLPHHPIPMGTKIFLCGHVHNKWKERVHEGIRVINVGADVNGLRPISIGELGLHPEELLKLHGILHKEAKS